MRTNAYVCSTDVADIDAASDKVPGVWHAYFIDPDGNQPDPAAR